MRRVLASDDNWEGSVTQFNGYFAGTTSRAEFNDTIAHNVLYFVYIGIAEFVTIYISTVGFIYTGEHISGKIRSHYLEACMGRCRNLSLWHSGF